jgi:hypothetical protein
MVLISIDSLAKDLLIIEEMTRFILFKYSELNFLRKNFAIYFYFFLEKLNIKINFKMKIYFFDEI